MVWLLTGIPALVVFLFVPSGSQLLGKLGPLLMILELGYVKPVSDAMIKVKRATGSVPIRERLKVAPWAIGLLIYILLFNVSLSAEIKVLMGCVAVALCSFWKIWIARRPIQPSADVFT